MSEDEGGGFWGTEAGEIGQSQLYFSAQHPGG
jgi:hypothetical protein